MDKTYSTPVDKDFYLDCFKHAVYVKFDRMHDDSWCRVTSDQPIEWFFDNIEKITSSLLITRNHQLRNEDDRWNADSHLELNIELRNNQTTYLLSIEIDCSYLDYFRNNYALT